MDENRRDSTVAVSSILIHFGLPLVLLLTSVVVLITTARWWTEVEYRLPGFPQDRYGFSLEDRLRWSAVDIDFLLGSDDISFYDDLFLDDGSPMHNARELSHMQDVKDLVDLLKPVWLLGVIILFAGAIIIWRRGELGVLCESLLKGSRLTFFVMISLGLLSLFAFGFLFVGFHRIFFEGTTWIFPYSDTFIRLYPQRFWQDTIAYLAVFTLLEAGVLYLLARRCINKRTKEQAA